MSSADDRYVIIKKTEKGWCVVLGGRNHFLLEAHTKKKKKKKTEKKVYREVINSENILSKPKRKTKCLAA